MSTAPEFVSYILVPADPSDAALLVGAATALPSLAGVLDVIRFHINLGVYRAGDRLIVLEQFDDPISDDDWSAIDAAGYEEFGELDVADGALLVVRRHEDRAAMASSVAGLGPDVDACDLDDERGRGLALRVSPGRYRVDRASLDVDGEAIAIVRVAKLD